MQDVTSDTAGAPQRVREARKAKGLSPEGLAYKAGVSLKTIERIERGETNPHRSTRHVIASVLGVDADALFPEPEPTAGAAA